MALKKKETCFSVLDIGSTKICAGISRLTEGMELELLGIGVVASRGIRNGGIVDLEEMRVAIRDAADETEKTAQASMGRLYLSINSRGLKSYNSSGSLQMGASPVPITQTHFQKCVDAASSVNIANTLEPLHTIVRHCLVDENMEVDNPLGMEGKRLEVGLHILALPKSQLTHFTKATNQAGLSVEKIVLQTLASADGVLNPEDKEFGTIFVEIGACTTTGIVFQKGKIQHSFSIPAGGDHFTRDIIVGLRATLKEAEKIKCQYGTLDPQSDPNQETFEIRGAGSGRPRRIAPQILTEIIQPRAEEILEYVRNEVTLAGFDSSQFACCVFSGGGAQLRQFVPLAEKVLDLPCRVGTTLVPEKWPAEFASPAYSCLMGLFQKARVSSTRKEMTVAERLTEGQGLAHRTSNRVKNWFQEILSF